MSKDRSKNQALSPEGGKEAATGVEKVAEGVRFVVPWVGVYTVAVVE